MILWIYNFLNKEVEKEIESISLEDNYRKILTIFSPAIPHFTSECFEDLGYQGEINWPVSDLKFLTNEKIDYVVQINGKKRAILKENRDIDQESLLELVKTNKLSKKYLKDKSINKVIFIKNRLINLLINE